MAIDVIELTKEDYVRALGMQRDQKKRNAMKVWGFAAMYGANRNLKILMPPGLLPEGFKPLDKR